MDVLGLFILMQSSVVYTLACSPESMRYLGEMIGPYVRELLQLHVDVQQEEQPRNCRQVLEPCILESDCCPENECTMMTGSPAEDGILSVCTPKRMDNYVEVTTSVQNSERRKDYAYDNRQEQNQQYAYDDRNPDEESYDTEIATESYYDDYVDHKRQEKPTQEQLHQVDVQKGEDIIRDNNGNMMNTSINNNTVNEQAGSNLTLLDLPTMETHELETSTSQIRQGIIDFHKADLNGTIENESTFNNNSNVHYASKNISNFLLNNTQYIGTLLNKLNKYTNNTNRIDSQYMNLNNYNRSKQENIRNDKIKTPNSPLESKLKFQEMNNKESIVNESVERNPKKRRVARSVNIPEFIQNTKTAIRRSMMSLGEKFIGLLNTTEMNRDVLEYLNNPNKKLPDNVKKRENKSADFSNKLLDLFNLKIDNNNINFKPNKTYSCNIENSLRLLKNFYKSKLNFKKNLKLLKNKLVELFPEFHTTNKAFTVDLSSGLHSDEKNIAIIEKLQNLYQENEAKYGVGQKSVYHDEKNINIKNVVNVNGNKTTENATLTNNDNFETSRMHNINGTSGILLETKTNVNSTR